MNTNTSLTKIEKKALVAKMVRDCKEISKRYVDNWKPVDPSWTTIEGCAYLRLSTDKQVMVEQGSLEQQIHIAVSEADIKSKEHKINYRIVRFFIEPGITGRHDKRPEFNALVEEISMSRYRFIIVKELARVCRNRGIWNDFIENCVNKDCEFVVRGLRLNPRDPVQRHILDELAGFASLESGINSKRQKESNHTRLTISKKFNSTPLILGLDQYLNQGKPVAGKYTNNKVEGEVAKWIFETFIATESEAATLKEMKEKGVKNKNGLDFNRQTLHRYLTNLKLISKAERNPENKDKDDRFLLPYERYELIENMGYDPVVSIDLWEKAQKIVKRNSENLRKNTRLKKVYLLSGLLKAPDMSSFGGSGANGKYGRKNYYYNRKHNFRIDADESEKAASQAVRNLIKDSESLLRSIKNYSKSKTRQDLLKAEVDRMDDLIAGLNVEKNTVTKRFDALIANGNGDRIRDYIGEFEKEMERINTEVSKLQAQRDTILRGGATSVDNFYDQFKDRLATARGLQNLIARKADPVLIKAAYAKLFTKAVAEPCLETGTYKLRFFIGEDSESSPSGEGGNGGQDSVTVRLVRQRGLEPPRGCPH